VRDVKFDVFLSHNSKDKDSVKSLGTALKKRGLTVWLDEWELRPGLTWQNALEEIVGECKAATVCFGPSGIGPWEEPEMQALLVRFVDEKRDGNILPIIPVLLPGAPADVKLPTFLKAFTWVDLRKGITPEGLERLQWGITGERRVENAPTVCLAKVTPDLRKARETVANYLTSARLNVLPAKPYSGDFAKYLPALQADLDQADVFVQILGETYADRTEELPVGEEIAQLALAQERGKVVLQWRDKSVDVSAIDDESHHELVDGPNVVCNDLLEFAKLIVDRAQRVKDVGKPAESNGKQWLALIRADKPDNVVADEICDLLTSANVNIRAPLTGKSMVECLREKAFDAVLIVCGSCSQDWLDARGNELMAVDLDFKDLAPVRAYYICADDTWLPYRSKGVHRVKHRDQEAWQRLLKAIQERGGRS